MEEYSGIEEKLLEEELERGTILAIEFKLSLKQSMGHRRNDLGNYPLSHLRVLTREVVSLVVELI